MRFFGSLSLAALVAVGTLLVPLPASAAALDLFRITSESPVDISDQLTVDVDVSDGYVHFLIANAGPVDSEITHIYFDDDADPSLLDFGDVLIDNGAGVEIVDGAHPAGFPRSLARRYRFWSDFGVSAAPGAANGLNPGELVTISIALVDPSTTPDMILDALDRNDIRLGLTVKRIRSSGGNGYKDLFLTDGVGGGGGEDPDGSPVPEPATVVLFACGSALALARRRRRSA